MAKMEMHAFVNDEGQPDGTPIIACVFFGADIVEYQNELSPAITMTPDRAREAGLALIALADMAEEEDDGKSTCGFSHLRHKQPIDVHCACRRQPRHRL
jgi:hypothetical protein